MTLELQIVDSRRSKRDFLSVPSLVYADDGAWVAPLRFVEARRLDPGRHPFYEHGCGRFWVAYRNGRPVGRIGAVVNDLHLDRYGDATGHFAMLETLDDPEAFGALVDAAGGWLVGQGMRRMAGPYNLSVNEELGTLVRGFDTAPMIMMGHGRRYYDRLYVASGFEKQKDLLAFRLGVEEQPYLVENREKFEALRERAGVTIRSSTKARLEADLRSLVEVFNRGWERNWGFVPLTHREVEAIVTDLKRIADPSLLVVAEKNGGAIAVLVGLPNINELLVGLDGRLFPLGWARLLWRLKTRSIRTGRILIAGVASDTQHSALAGVLPVLLIDAVRRAGVARGITSAEASWVLEDNRRVLRYCELGGFEPYKTYRLYQRDLARA